MAILNNNVLGNIRGKLGNKVIRLRNGKFVVYTKPLVYNLSHSAASQKARSKFAFAVKLAKLINSTPELAAVWKSSKVQGSNSYQKIIKHNLKFMSDAGLTSASLIVPPHITPETYSIKIDRTGIILHCTSSQIPSGCQFEMFVVVFIADNQKSCIHLVRSGTITQSSNYHFNASITFNNTIRKQILRYGNATALCTVVSNTKKVLWTNTITAKFITR